MGKSIYKWMRTRVGPFLWLWTPPKYPSQMPQIAVEQSDGRRAWHILSAEGRFWGSSHQGNSMGGFHQCWLEPSKSMIIFLVVSHVVYIMWFISWDSSMEFLIFKSLLGWWFVGGCYYPISWGRNPVGESLWNDRGVSSGHCSNGGTPKKWMGYFRDNPSIHGWEKLGLPKKKYLGNSHWTWSNLGCFRAPMDWKPKKIVMN